MDITKQTYTKQIVKLILVFEIVIIGFDQW